MTLTTNPTRSLAAVLDAPLAPRTTSTDPVVAVEFPAGDGRSCGLRFDPRTAELAAYEIA
ncbi:hypothetical protein C8N24_0314 [Solirubrobacter pauli]|uniref:Uncharacterized protein n=1 Tax=Solirubrobacter pauli TaxID=166793 RepID=A0A660L7N4_9ACTN|nr:hypothetical protein [Solirubrobacter pauli]RKQ90509.1 hypothetical protein C8N24_0314 [Solirubrobacter pauli]